MPLSIKVEDFKGEVLLEFFDQKGSLNKVIKYCYENPTESKVMKYIDLYDDTVFNSIQVKDFLMDIAHIKKNNFDVKELTATFSELVRLCNFSLEEPHQYLKFYGD